MENPAKLFLLVVSVAAVLFIAGCTVGPLIEKISVGVGCGESNLGASRCSNNSMGVEQCSKMGDNYVWFLKTACAQGQVCDLAVEENCVDGCRYTDSKGNLWGLKESQNECDGNVMVNCLKTSEGLLDISTVDCLADDKVCQDGACIASSGTPETFSLKLNYGDELGEKLGEMLGQGIAGHLTSSEFPVLLKGGDMKYNSEGVEKKATYTQVIQFLGTAPDNDGTALGTGQLVFAAKTDGDKNAADYLAFDSDSIDNAFKYTFRTSACCNINPSNFVGTKFTMLGKEYTITSINSEFTSMEATDGQNTYRFENGWEAYKNGVKISGSKVLVKQDYVESSSEEGYRWNGLLIDYAPIDEIYVPEAGSFIDPIFGSFAIKLRDIQKNAEQIDLTTSGQTAELKFADNSGKEVLVSFSWDGEKIVGTNTWESMETTYGAIVGITGTTLRDDFAHLNIYIVEENTANNALDVKIGLGYNLTTNKFKVMEPLISEAGSGPQWYKSDIRASTLAKDTRYYVTEWGTLMIYDSAYENMFNAWYPDTQVFGNVDITSS